MMRVLGGRLTHQFKQRFPADAHLAAVDLGVGPAPDIERFPVAELDAQFLDNAHGEFVDHLHALFIDDLVDRHIAHQRRVMHELGLCPRLAPAGTPASALNGVVCHAHLPSAYMRGRWLPGS